MSDHISYCGDVVLASMFYGALLLLIFVLSCVALPVGIWYLRQKMVKK